MANQVPPAGMSGTLRAEQWRQQLPALAPHAPESDLAAPQQQQLQWQPPAAAASPAAQHGGRLPPGAMPGQQVFAPQQQATAHWGGGTPSAQWLSDVQDTRWQPPQPAAQEGPFLGAPTADAAAFLSAHNGSNDTVAHRPQSQSQPQHQQRAAWQMKSSSAGEPPPPPPSPPPPPPGSPSDAHVK